MFSCAAPCCAGVGWVATYPAVAARAQCSAAAGGSACCRVVAPPWGHRCEGVCAGLVATCSAGARRGVGACAGCVIASAASRVPGSSSCCRCVACRSRCAMSSCAAPCSAGVGWGEPGALQQPGEASAAEQAQVHAPIGKHKESAWGRVLGHECSALVPALRSRSRCPHGLRAPAGMPSSSTRTLRFPRLHA